VDRATAAYEAARDEAEQHGVAGERAHGQTQRACVLAFTDDELALAEQLLLLLTGNDLRVTTLSTRTPSSATLATTTPASTTAPRSCAPTSALA
jgi:hypothetical protein